MKEKLNYISEKMRGKGVPFQYLRRITGYLAPTNQWSNGKKAELHDRVVHTNSTSDSKE